MSRGIPLLLASGAALLLLSGKKRRSIPSAKTDTKPVSTMPEPNSNKVIFSLEFDKYAMGIKWKYTVLEKFLNEKRESGELLTKESLSSWWYDTFIRDPGYFIGDITGLGSNVGFGVYASLWLIATGGLASLAIGGAAVGAAGTILVSSTTAGWALTGLSGALASTGIGFGAGLLGKISDWISAGSAKNEISESQYKPLMDEAVSKFPLWEKYPEAAASALQIFSEFASRNSVLVGPAKEESLISELPPTVATADFYKKIMSLIYKYQSSVFE